MLGRICGTAIALGLLSAPALSETVEHAYTSFDSKTCKHTKGKDVEDYGSWLCNGYAGLRIQLSAVDQRMTAAFGPTEKVDLAQSQTLPGFNESTKARSNGAWKGTRTAGRGHLPRSCAGAS